MPDYSKFSERNLRNKKPTNAEEKAYQEMLVQQEVDKITSKYSDEPKFLNDVAFSLAQHILKSNTGIDNNDTNLLDT